MGRAYGMLRRNEKHIKFWSENLKTANHTWKTEAYMRK
jgi:hypothetical protein